MTRIEKLMGQYQAAEEVTKTDMSEWPMKTRPGMQMRIQECKTELESLKQKFNEHLRANAFTIFLAGDPAHTQAFASVAEQEAGTINIPGDGLYQSLADNLESSIGDRGTFGTTQLSLLIRTLTTLCRDLTIKNIPMPTLVDLIHCHSRVELVTVIRDLIRASSGDTVAQKWIEHTVAEQALAIRYTRSVIPVIVTGVTPDELLTLPQELFSKTSFTVNVTEENSVPEQVLKVLGDIKSSLKSKRS